MPLRANKANIASIWHRTRLHLPMDASKHFSQQFQWEPSVSDTGAAPNTCQPVIIKGRHSQCWFWILSNTGQTAANKQLRQSQWGCAVRCNSGIQFIKMKKETTTCSLHLPLPLKTCVFLYKPVWTLIRYLADVNGLCSVACLYQEFVSQNGIIWSIFVIVVSDLPSFPVAVKCILKSWIVKRCKGKTEQSGKYHLETNFNRKKE